MVSALGAFALLLAAVGLYGIRAYSVTTRVREIAVRLALGANPGNVSRMVLGSSIRLVLSGAAAGVPLALAAAQAARQLLFGVQPSDGAPIVIATSILAVVGMLAGDLPARRAARVDPIVALRAE